MRILERFRASAATATFSQSSSVSLPVTSFLLSTKHSLEIRRRASCSRLISREKKATFCRRLLARLQQDVQGHGGLAHAGAGGQQDQVGLVQAGDGPVQVGQAGGQAGDGLSLAASS